MFQQNVIPESRTKILNLIRLDLYETGTYATQFRRGIDSTLTSNTMSKLEEHTQGGAFLSTGVLNNVASDIIIPSTKVEGQIGIADGWDNKKFRFLMEIEVVNAFGGFRNRKVITGWTNHAEVMNLMGGDNSNTHIDPNMLMFINSDLTLRDSQVPDGRGGVTTRTTRVNADQLIQGSFEMGGMGDVSIRPEDIVAGMSVGTDIMANSGQHVRNTYSQFVTSPVKFSARSNQSPTHYLHKILKSHSEANDHGHGNDAEEGYDDVMINTLSSCQERTLSDDPFIDQLKMCSDFIDNGYFTFQSLMQMFPDVDPKTTIHRYGGSQIIVTPPTAGDSTRMDLQDQCTMVMARITNSLPSMLFDCLLGAVGVVYTNDVPGSQGQLIPMDAVFFGSIVSGLDLSIALREFQGRFLSEIAPVISHQNQVKITVKIIANVFGNTELTINYNDSGEYTYKIPTWCDTLLSPLVTSSHDKTAAMTRDIRNIMSGVGGGESYLNPGSVSSGNNAQQDFMAQWAQQPVHQAASLFSPAQPSQVVAGTSTTPSLF